MKVASNDSKANLRLMPESIKAFFASDIVLTAKRTGKPSSRKEGFEAVVTKPQAFP
jgi:hypothetical protein